VFPGASANFLTKIEHQTSPSYQKVTETVYSCNYSTIWIQVIAHNFSKGFKDTQCPSDGLSGATTYASYKAKVAGVAAQVAAHRGELGQGVLVTLMVGQWDILELYGSVHAGSMTQASAEAELKGRAGTLANVVKDIISTGAKVVLGLTPDLGQSPLAVTGGNDQALLFALTKVFNDTLYITNLGNQSGRELAGVNPEPFTNPTVRSAAYVYNVAACDPALATHPDAVAAVESDDDKKVKFCTASTLVSTTTAYMWADNTHFTPAGHNLIGSAGFNRAYNQF
jgi:phospholipase/lecithinase/hemolysin